MSLFIQEMKTAEKSQNQQKNSMQQTTNGEQPTKSPANQHRVREVSCNALLVK